VNLNHGDRVWLHPLQFGYREFLLMELSCEMVDGFARAVLRRLSPERRSVRNFAGHRSGRPLGRRHATGSRKRTSA
jgi:hypothetical protein